MGYLLVFRWNTSTQLERQQRALIAGIENNKWSKCEKRIAADYKDRWGWKRDDLKLLFQDVRSQFLSLGIALENPVWDITGDEATLSAVVRLEGSPIGVGSSIQSVVNRESAPMIFTWRKESWQPWSWKLVRMNHPEIEVDGYEPGDLMRARNSF